MREIPRFAPGARNAARAATSPSGVNAHPDALSAAARDSIATAVMESVPRLARMREQTADEKEQLRRQQEPGLSKEGRAARLPGALVCAPTMGGNYTCARTMLSFALPGRDRAKDIAVDAANRESLRRLQDRIALRRDSIRADSVRRDSMARAPAIP